jgi:hypothetical protein
LPAFEVDERAGLWKLLLKSFNVPWVKVKAKKRKVMLVQE